MSMEAAICEVFRPGNLSKVLELLSRGFNMNVRYIARKTTYQGDPQTGCYVEVRYMETPLIAAVTNGHQNCVNLLIVAGADVNFPGSVGLAPLMYAIIHNQPDLQTILIYNGADINCIDHFHETALVKAVV